MKQGLLFKESPEPRIELFCERYPNEYKDGKCNLQFFSVREFEKHMLEVHDSIPGKFKGGFYGTRNGPSWFNKEYLEREDFIHLRFVLPTRPQRRWNCTQQEARNLDNKKCWCGKARKDFDKHQITYCCKEHNDQWWIKTDYVGPHKDKYLKDHDKCEHCNKVVHYNYYGNNLEVDHIIAIILGGHPWHDDNLQALCSECHKIKTKSDVAILAWWKRECKYDLGPIIPDNQTLLESFTV